MRITFQRGSRAGESKEFSPPGFFIGREDDNDIVLECGKVSQHHLKIFFEDGTWKAHELGSSNGTRINGKALRDHKILRSGDMIYLGSEALKVEIPESPIVSADVSPADAVNIRPPGKCSGDTPKKSEINDIKTSFQRSEESPRKNIDKAEKRQLEKLLQEALAEKKRKLTIISIIIAVVANIAIFLWWFFRIGCAV